MSWTSMGRELGYPECCIAAFTNRSQLLITGPLHEFQRARMYQFEHNGEATGYLMCSSCAQRNREELVAEINARRDKSYPPFPTEFLP